MSRGLGDALVAAATSGASPTVIAALRDNVGVGSRELEERFIEAAKKDLGITG